MLLSRHVLLYRFVSSGTVWTAVLLNPTPFSISETDAPNTVQCVYKTENDCVMKFTYSEHASGQSVLTALKEPGQYLALPL